MSRAALNLVSKTTDTIVELTTLIEYARQITARARRARHSREMRAARRIGEQLHAQRTILRTVYDRELLASARALMTVAHGHLDAITEELDASESRIAGFTGPRVHAVQVISQRRALENLHA